MKSNRIFFVFAVTTSLLLSGVVWSKPGEHPDAPPTVDANVVNTPLAVNVAPPDFEQIATDVVHTNQSCPGNDVIYTVPTGYRLKIVYAFMRALDAANTDAILSEAGVTLSISSTANGNFWYASLVFSNEIPLGGAKNLEVYADPDEEVRARWEGCSNNMSLRSRIIGQLIPVEE